MAENKQIKSKKRVADHGEVFTPEHIVNDMLDLVKNETERIDSRFLEPACGNGNFLIEILRRKLNIVKDRYKKNQTDYERYAIVAVSSCYGVDILEDNCAECRERLLNFFETEYKGIYKKETREQIIEVIKFILSKNIIWGDALTLKTNNGEPIVFCEWSAVNHIKMKRRDFTLANLLETENYYTKASDNQDNMFTMFREQGVDLITPKAVGEYPICNFDEINKADLSADRQGKIND